MNEQERQELLKKAKEANLTQEERIAALEVAAYILAHKDSIGSDWLLADHKDEIGELTPERVAKLVDLISIVSETVDKAKRAGAATSAETAKAYKDNMRGSDGEWLSDPDEILNAEHLKKYTDNILCVPEQERLYNNAEHDLLKLVYHFYMAAMADMFGGMVMPVEYAEKAEPQQIDAITKWELKYNKNVKHLSEMVSRSQAVKYCAMSYDADYHRTYEYHTPKDNEEEDIEATPLPAGYEHKPLEEALKAYQVKSGYLITSDIEMFAVSILANLLKKDRFGIWQDQRARGRFPYPETAITNSIMTAGSQYNPAWHSIDAILDKSELMKSGADIKRLADIMNTGNYDAHVINKQVVLLMPKRLSEEAGTIARQLFIEAADYAAWNSGDMPLDIMEYMKQRGITHKQSAEMLFVEITEYLSDIKVALCVDKEKKYYGLFPVFIPIIDVPNNTTAGIRIARDFAEELKRNKSKFLIVSRGIQSIDARYSPYAYGFGEAIIKNMTMNAGKINAFIVSVSNITSNTRNFSEYLKREEANRKTRRAMRVFDSNLNEWAAKADYLWQYSNGAKDSENMNYQQWKKEKIIVSFGNNIEEENNEIIKANIEYKATRKKRTQEEEQEILEQAKEIKRRQRRAKQETTRKQPE